MLAGSSGLGGFNPDVPNFMGIGNLGQESAVQVIMPIAGTFSHLNVSMSFAPGAGRAWVFTLNSNGLPTPLSCTISGSGLACGDSTDTASFAAGDRVDVVGNATVPSITFQGASATWTVETN
jgi:hypothetical protein